MANVSIELGKKIKVENTDNIIDISGYGKLVFSRGSAEWIPYKNSVNQRKFSWKEFAAALEAGGTPIAVRKTPKAKKAVKTTATPKTSKP